jgi:CRISPR-associated protein Cas1
VKARSGSENVKPRLSDRRLFAAATHPQALDAAWARVRANAGAAGGDGMTTAVFGMAADRHLARLRRAMLDGTYRPKPIRRVSIPKPGGGERGLAIPSVQDRVAQTAVAQALAPALDAEFEESSFGYRAGRSVQDAVRLVAELRKAGLQHVVDADITSFFDSVPHDRLLDRLAASMDEGALTALIALWLEHGGTDGRGLAQGSPLSPLLANLYLDRLDEAFSGRSARIIRFADDFVILCAHRAGAEAALSEARALLRQEGLALKPEKTRVTSFDQGFRFLGTLFVRSLALTSPEPPEDETAELMRRLAEADEARAGAAASRAEAEAKDRAEGLDRVQRVLYLVSADRRLHIRNQAFIVEAGSGDPGETQRWRETLALPHQAVDRVEIGPAAEATPAALRHALATGTPLAFTNGFGETMGWVSPGVSPHAARHLAQARHTLDAGLRLDLARRFVEGRLRNQRALLRRLNRDKQSGAVSQALAALNGILRELPGGQTVAEVMGQEGRAAALFWPAYGALLDHGFGFTKREREQPDAANLLLNAAASLLLRDVTIAVQRAGLHPGFAVLHGTEDHRDSTALDLAEEFRAPLVESVVAQAVNNRAVALDSFESLESGRLRFRPAGYTALLRAYERAAEREVRSARDGRRRTWRGIMLEQARALAAHVEGRGPYVPYVMDY